MTEWMRLRRSPAKGIQVNLQTEDRLIPAMRVFFALLALLAVRMRSVESVPGFAAVIVFLALYAFCSTLLFLRLLQGGKAATALASWVHWADVGWCVVVAYLSREAGNIFFIGFLFPIIAASVRWGLDAGLRVTILSVVSVAVISVIPLPGLNVAADRDMVLLKSAWLLGLGYILAHWGESELTHRRRLALVELMTAFSNPRLGIDRTIGSILGHLKSFYRADSVLLVLADPEGEGFRHMRLSAQDSEAVDGFEPFAPELARPLLELSKGHAVVRNARSGGWWRFWKSDQQLDIESGLVTRLDRSALEGLATVLDAKAFVTVPVRFRSEGSGRLYVVARKPVFVPSDMHFLLRVLDHVTPVIENIRLVEQLAAHAADEERHKIARDIHDSVIQPYLGLQMGLAALNEKVNGRFPELSKQIEQLMALAGSGVNDLRNYVSGLKHPEGGDGGLLPAMRRFAATFSDATGIAVRIEAEGEIHAGGRLAAETFQMMAEGLSNIRRHTRAVRATVRLACHSGHLILAIINESPGGPAPRMFTPRSITERAESLGGTVRVSVLPDGGSAVTVDIPL